MPKKVNLNALRVKSFVTSVEDMDQGNIKAGASPITQCILVSECLPCTRKCTNTCETPCGSCETCPQEC